MTIYAKQVPPEYQISTFDYANYEDIILTGNRRFQEYWPNWAEYMRAKKDRRELTPCDLFLFEL